MRIFHGAKNKQCRGLSVIPKRHSADPQCPPLHAPTDGHLSSGIVISRAHRAGEDVARGDVLAQMADIQNTEVRAFVPLKHLPRTTVADAIEIFATNTNFEGHIRALIPTVDMRSQTFEAIIDLPQSASADWTVGQLVSIAVPIKARASSLTVPRDALVLRSDGSFVFRISPENKAERIKVEVGDSSGTLVAVSGSLMEGDRVAVRGAENLREGADVKVMLSSQSNAWRLPASFQRKTFALRPAKSQ